MDDLVKRLKGTLPATVDQILWERHEAADRIEALLRANEDLASDIDRWVALAGDQVTQIEALLRERDVMEDGLRTIGHAPIPPLIGPAHELTNIARRTLSRLHPIQGSAEHRDMGPGFTHSETDCPCMKDK